MKIQVIRAPTETMDNKEDDLSITLRPHLTPGAGLVKGFFYLPWKLVLTILQFNVAYSPLVSL